VNLNWVYIAISWILLRWHDLWQMFLGASSGVAWVLSIVFLVITVRVILFPVFVKQIKSQRAMQAIQPQVKALQEKYKSDKEKLQREVMELYRREKANPLMGCLPIFLQIPVFLGLFHVLRLIDPTRPSAFKAMTEEYGWPRVAFHQASEARLFGAPLASAFTSSDRFLSELGVSRLNVQIVAATLVLIMVVTTYITQRQMISRNGPAADPTQAMIQRIMLYGIPASLLVSGAIFPLGVVVYWVTTNLFSMGQQFWVLRQMPPIDPHAKQRPDVETAKALAPKPGVRPVNPKRGGRSVPAPEGAVASSSETAKATKPAASRPSSPRSKRGKGRGR
jgi:YidC/Oxa1 family membrane protein insertase